MTNDETYRWIASLIDQEGNNYGDISFYKNEVETNGFILVEGKVMSLIDLKSNTLTNEKLLVVSSYRSQHPNCCQTPEQSDNVYSPSDEYSETEKRQACSVVDILVLYTQEAADESDMSMESLAELCTMEANKALLNSDIQTHELEFNLLEVRMIQGFEETEGPIENDLEELQDNESAREYRDILNADIVVLFTSILYQEDGGGTTFGATYSPAVAENAYCVVNYRFANTRKIFQHELAHNFGCDHRFCEEPSSTCTNSEGINHGYVIDDRVWYSSKNHYATIMVSGWNEIGNPTQILHFSNPEVEYNGYATGTEDRENNALVMKQNACEVANFEVNDRIIVNITGDDYICDDFYSYWESTVSGGNPPYTYTWQISTNPWNYGPELGNYPGFSYQANTATWHYLKLTIEDSQGFIEEAYKTLPYSCQGANLADNNTNYLNQNNNINLEQNDLVENLSVFPNPFKEATTVTFTLGFDTSMELKIYSTTGQLVKTIPHQFFAKGINRFDIQREDMTEGVYFLQLEGKEHTLREIIVIQ